MDGASQNPNRKGRESYARPFSGLRLWPKSKATRLCDCPKLSIGSLVYSKSPITNSVERYSIANILPDIFGVSDSDISNRKGLIVLGYDEETISNIQTNYIYFDLNDYSLINASGASIAGPLCSLDTLRNNIRAVHLRDALLEVLMMTAVLTGYFISLLIFNRDIYKKRREFGDVDVYKEMFIDFLAYYSLILLPVGAGYLICSIWLSFSIEVFLEMVTLTTIAFVFFYLMQRKTTRRS